MCWLALFCLIILRLNLDWGTLNLDWGTLNLDGGTRPPNNLSTGLDTSLLDQTEFFSQCNYIKWRSFKTFDFCYKNIVVLGFSRKNVILRLEMQWVSSKQWIHLLAEAKANNADHYSHGRMNKICFKICYINIVEC